MAVKDPQNSGRDAQKRAPASSSSRTPNSARPASGTRPPGPRSYEAPPMSVEGIRRGCLGTAASKVVLGLLLLVFAGGVMLTGLGSNGFNGINNTGDLNQNNGGNGANSDAAAATVGGQTVKTGDLNRAFNSMQQMYQQYGFPMDTGQLLNQRQRTLKELTDREALVQDAQKQGFVPSSADLDAAVQKKVDDDIKQQEGANPAVFRRQVEASGNTLDELRTTAVQNADRDEIGRQWSVDKLQAKVNDANKVTEADYQRSVTKLHLQQILVQPSPATNDASRARSQAEAKARADRLVKQLGAAPTAAQFAALARTQSDDSSTKAKGGDLGFKLPTDFTLLPATVRDSVVAASKPLIGPIQDPDTKAFYIFHVAAKQLQLPKDYAQKKAKYLKDFETQKDGEAWQKYQDNVSKAATVEINDPALIAYRDQDQLRSVKGDAANQLRQNVISNYETALTSASGQYAAAIQVQLVALYRASNQLDKALTALQGAVRNAPDEIPLRLDLARVLQGQKKNDEALAQLAEASKHLDRAPAQPSFSMSGSGSSSATQRFEIAALYDALGKKALAQQERAKALSAAKTPASNGLGNLQVTPHR